MWGTQFSLQKSITLEAFGVIAKLSLSPSFSFSWKAEVALFLVNPATHPTRESLFGSPAASNLGHIWYLSSLDHETQE